MSAGVPLSAGVPPSGPESASADRVELFIARVLAIGAVLAVGLLVIGIVLMLGAGISPDAEAFPVFDPALVVGDLLALRPAGFLWAGIVVVIATPVVRVAGELLGFSLRRDRRMALVAAGVLAIIAVSVVTALVAEA